ncbi:MAG: transcriptional regulator FeaR [Pseudomonas sp.]|uniref:transcriptional regulator FeaR n=1 Tax=Pseudomonas abieticivorans TaxID=2931382 RepID=UPI0020BEB3AE|nr:transcriptional regulator FeaR [Pseudomonas sp. PIA16]MDE1164799.1 transcriptional regulator FeaR [Pseudomonas sp.]
MNEHPTHDFSRWSSTLQNVCGRFSTRPAHGEALFIGDVQRHLLGSTEVARIRTNAASIKRRQADAGSDDDRFCFLVLQKEGAMDIDLGTERLTLNTGDMALLDSSKAYEMLPHGLFTHVSIHLSREKLPVRGSRFGKLSPAGMSGQVLRTVVRQVAFGDLDQWATPQEGEALEDALLALLNPVMHYDYQPLVCDSLRLQAERLIQYSLGNHTLSPLSLAAQLHISVRQLYRLFELEGDSVCRYIQRTRLQTCARELLDPAMGHESITDIAFRWGFTDAAHFSRVFKRQFEVSPRDYRRG